MSVSEYNALIADPDVWKQYYSGQFPSTVTIDVPGGFSGRYVMVVLSGTNNLSLAEVEIDSTATRYYLAVKGKNIKPHDLYIWLQTDSVGNMCSNAAEGTDYQFDYSYFDASYTDVSIPASSTTAKIDFEDDIDVYKVKLNVPGTLEIKGFNNYPAEKPAENLIIRLKDENHELIETDVAYGINFVRADLYNMSYCYVEIQKKEGADFPAGGIAYDFDPRSLSC